jgi:hypothetical protein
MESNSKQNYFIGVFLVCAFLIMRIVLLQEPWNSDDIRYFEMAEKLNTGEHVIQRATLPAQVFHADIRFGLLLPLALVIRSFGYHIVAYYLLPMLFSLAGFILIIKITGEVLPRTAVIAAAVLHLVSPFETRHSSVLVTDLSAAFLTLLFIYYIYKNPLDEFHLKQLLARSFVGSLLVFWPYLIRDNQPVLLLPALAVLLLYRPYRLTVAGSMVLFSLWVLLEQWFYTTKGAPIGFRWNMLVAGQHDYMQYYPKYTPSQYLIRSFRFIVVDIGWLGLLFFVGAIASHIHAFFVSKNVLVRACLAAGFFTYLIFTFYVYGSANGRLIVMTSQHRFVQLFYYTSILAIGITLVYLAPKVRARFPNLRAFRVAGGALFVVTLVYFGHASYAHAGRLFSTKSDLWAALGALDAEIDREDPASITLTGTDHSLRVLRLFPKTRRGRNLACQIVSHDELLHGLTARHVEWSLMDQKREQRDLIYIFGEDRKHRERLLEEIERRAASDYRLVFHGRSLNLYRRAHPGTAP